MIWVVFAVCFAGLVCLFVGGLLRAEEISDFRFQISDFRKGTQVLSAGTAAGNAEDVPKPRPEKRDSGD